jgi:hypothetical protein
MTLMLASNEFSTKMGVALGSGAAAADVTPRATTLHPTKALKNLFNKPLIQTPYQAMFIIPVV